MKRYIFLLMFGNCFAVTRVVPAKPIVGHVDSVDVCAVMRFKDNDAKHINAVESSYQQRLAYKHYLRPRRDKDEPIGINKHIKGIL